MTEVLIPYQSFRLCNAGSEGAYDIAMNAYDSNPDLTLADPFLVVYDGASLPANPNQCRALNDNGPIPRGALIDGLVVGAGAFLTVVPSSFGFNRFGRPGPPYDGVGSFEVVITRR